jgi:acyl carrier protein
VAYVTATESGETPTAERLRVELVQQLPEYMVPAAYVVLAQWPLTPNGKLDRKALPAPDADAHALRGYEAPQGEIEATLAGIWSELLGLERVGRQDHFFELGGHSLLAVQLISRVRQEFKVEIPLAEVFLTPDLLSLGEKILDAQLSQYDMTELVGLLDAQQKSVSQSF